MTVAAATRKAGPLTGDGVNASFPFTFKVFQASDVLVVQTDLNGNETTQTLTSQYTVALNSNQDSNPGGTVTMLAAPAVGYLTTIGSQVPQAQLTVLTNTGGFFPTVINDMLDRVTILVQQLSEKLGRALSLPFSAPAGTSLTLPLPQSSKLIGWNAAANGLQNVDASTLASIVAYGTANADQFVGTGAQTVFTLSANPGALNNLIVAVGGVVQRPGTDYTLSSTSLTFTVAPPNTVAILARYMQALPQGTSDSAASTFIQSGTGAVSRFAQDKMRERVSVKDFGAKGDGVTDDGAAFQLAFTASGNVFVPDGVYIIGRQLTASNKNFSLTGSGAGVCELRFTGGAASGIAITQDHNYRVVNFSDFDITTATSNLGTAISVTYPGASEGFNDRYDVAGTFTRVRVKQPTGSITTAGWKYGFTLTEMCNVLINACTFTGQMTNAGVQEVTPKSITAITFTGTFFPVDIKISDSYITGWDIATNFGGPVQGVDFNHCTFIFVRIAIQWFASPIGQPYLNVCDCHVNCWQNGVAVTGINQSFIHGCLFYASANERQAASLLDIGVSCSSFDIHDNQFVSYATTYPANLIVMESGEGTNVVHDNVLSSSGLTNTGIWLKSTASPMYLYKNLFLGNYSIQSIYDQSGTTNQVYGTRTALVSRGTTYSLPNNVGTAIPWDSINYDSGALAPSANGTLFTVAAGKGIKAVRVACAVEFAGNATGFRDVQIYKNGSPTYAGSPAGTISALTANTQGQQISTPIIPVADGDTFSVVAFQNSGGALNLNASKTWFSIEVID